MNELSLKLSDFLKKKAAMEVLMIPKTIQLATRSYKL
jgi:hypothetical protein